MLTLVYDEYSFVRLSKNMFLLRREQEGRGKGRKREDRRGDERQREECKRKKRFGRGKRRRRK